jgi:hypothetical protein
VLVNIRGRIIFARLNGTLLVLVGISISSC